MEQSVEMYSSPVNFARRTSSKMFLPRDPFVVLTEIRKNMNLQSHHKCRLPYISGWNIKGSRLRSVGVDEFYGMEMTLLF
jgi:hypothetical protein